MSGADRCVNCAFGARACRQCRDRAQLAAALAEVERVKARLAETERLLEASSANHMDLIIRVEAEQAVDRIAMARADALASAVEAGTLDADGAPIWERLIEYRAARPAAPKGGE